MTTSTFVDNIKYHFDEIYNFSSIKPDADTIQSSVSIILRKKNTNYEVLLIKRTVKDSDKFSGHMAFPGGVKEDFDNDLIDWEGQTNLGSPFQLNFKKIKYLGLSKIIKQLENQNYKYISVKLVKNLINNLKT